MTSPTASPTSLAERRAIVTGGASGIGRASALALARCGAEVVVADVDTAAGADVAAETDGIFVELDVADPAAWDAVVDAHGPFDLAVLNAGVDTGEERDPADLPLTALTLDRYRRIMGINVDGVVLGARAVLPHMLERGSGDIVCTASIAGLAPIANDPIYGLTKHAVVGFVRSFAQAAAQRGLDICVTAICPGFTDTKILTPDGKEMVRQMGFGLLDPAEVGEVVVRSVHERPNGGQWVIWSGAEPRLYEWNPVDPPQFGAFVT